MEPRLAQKVRVSIFLLLRCNTSKHQPRVYSANARSALGTGGCWSESSPAAEAAKAQRSHLHPIYTANHCQNAAGLPELWGAVCLAQQVCVLPQQWKGLFPWGRQGCQEPPEPRSSIKALPLGLIALMCNEDVQKWSNHHQPLKRANR